MSIINDALKKARDTKTAVKASANYNIRGGLETKKETGRIRSTRIPAVIYIAALLVFFIIGFTGLYFYRAKQSKGNMPVHEAGAQNVLLYNQATGADQFSGGENFIPYAQEEVMPELLLTGIVHGQGSPMAVINGSVYIAGDKIKGFEISKILKNSVLFEKNGETVEIKVK
jgi:hypothetical protein